MRPMPDLDSPSPTGVGPEEAQALMAQGALLLDVREPFEWEAGHAPEAQHIPMASVPERLDEVPPGQQVVVVCRSGGRSARVTAVLVDAGRDAVNLEGGMQAWAAAGLAVEGPDGGPGSVA